MRLAEESVVSGQNRPRIDNPEGSGGQKTIRYSLPPSKREGRMKKQERDERKKSRRRKMERFDKESKSQAVTFGIFFLIIVIIVGIWLATSM